MYRCITMRAVPVGYFGSKISFWRSGSCISPASTAAPMPTTWAKKHPYPPGHNNKLSNVYTPMRLPFLSTCKYKHTSIIRKKIITSVRTANILELQCRRACVCMGEGFETHNHNTPTSLVMKPHPLSKLQCHTPLANHSYSLLWEYFGCTLPIQSNTCSYIQYMQLIPHS